MITITIRAEMSAETATAITRYIGKPDADPQQVIQERVMLHLRQLADAAARDTGDTELRERLEETRPEREVRAREEDGGRT